jgi:ATP sulfurylase
MSQIKALIQPHGGKLINCHLFEQERQKNLFRASNLPRLNLSARNLADLECIATGVYSPLEGFVDEQEYNSIVKDMRLTNGFAWSIPVTLQVPESIANQYQLDTEIALTHPNGAILAVMAITSKFKPDQDLEAKKVYGTNDEAHPGIQAMRQEGEVYLGGAIKVINPIPYEDFLSYRLTPEATRIEFARRAWNTVVAFQTRNPIHRAHEYITKIALEVVDGLFINPLVGQTKSKVKPLRGKLATLDAWITGQRKDQNPETRASVPVIQIDTAFSTAETTLIKFNPLSNWTSAQVWQYIQKNEIPYNQLHAKGFTSIGCEPCTRAILPNQHERLGRWWWEEAADKECGFHEINLTQTNN